MRNLQSLQYGISPKDLENHINVKIDNLTLIDITVEENSVKRCLVTFVFKVDKLRYIKRQVTRDAYLCQAWKKLVNDEKVDMPHYKNNEDIKAAILELLNNLLKDINDLSIDYKCLIGKTIEDISEPDYTPSYNENFLIIKFTDGSVVEAFSYFDDLNTEIFFVKH